jgi:putative membrane protein
MIDYDGRRWGSVIFTLRGSIVPRLLGRVLVAALIGMLAVHVHKQHQLTLSPIAHTMIGAALGLLLVFRTNASYDRYWEGRRLLGGMIVRSRDFARQLAAFVGDERARMRMRNWIDAFYRLSAQTLRRESALESIASLRETERAALAASPSRPQVVLTWITQELVRLVAAGALTEERLRLMDLNLSGLVESLAGCERILRTPVPFAYAQHIKTFVALFVFTAPFTMSEAMGWLTPVASGLLAFALFGIDEIGVEIEDPFGRDANDLPVDAIGDGIDVHTRDIVSASIPS